jgi:hypothetical protein
MRRRYLWTAATFISLSCGSVHGHHSFAGTYLVEQRGTIEGTVLMFQIRNPHSFLNLEIKAADGKTSLWGVEWDSVTHLTQTGVTATTLKVGDRVTITGSPSKDPAEHKMLMRKIERPSDGWTWEGQAGGRYAFAASAAQPPK